MECLPVLLYRQFATRYVCRSCASGPLFRHALKAEGSGASRRLTRNGDSRRIYHTTSQKKQEAKHRGHQAQPLGDFYTDLLAEPLPRTPRATSLPTFVRSGDETKEERARKLFGNIKGSGYERRSDKPDATWRTINGVPVPPRPAEPDNCCMSGCAHCVWDDYRDDVESWAGRLHEAQAKGERRSKITSPKVEMNRPEVSESSVSMDDDGGGSEALWDTPSTPGHEVEEVFSQIPIGIRAFMEAEKMIRDRKRSRKSGKR